LAMCAFLAIITAPYIDRIKALVWVGKHSLFIFLIHQMIYHALLLISLKAGVEFAGDFYYMITLGIVYLLATLGLSALTVIGLEKTPLLKRLILPRDWDDWPPCAFLKKPKAPA